MDLSARINQFRLASRELFNHFFRVEDPYANEEAWALEERHSEVEYLLFEKMVLEPTRLPYVRYGELNPKIRVELSGGQFAPIMLNRERDSGYWDHPVTEVTQDVKLGVHLLLRLGQPWVSGSPLCARAGSGVDLAP